MALSCQGNFVQSRLWMMNFHLETMSHDSSVFQCGQPPLLRHWFLILKLRGRSSLKTVFEPQTSKHRFDFVIVCLSCVEQACTYTIIKRGWVHKRLLESWTSQSPIWLLDVPIKATRSHSNCGYVWPPRRPSDTMLRKRHVTAVTMATIYSVLGRNGK